MDRQLACPFLKKYKETNMEKALKKFSPFFVLPTFLAFLIGFIIPFIEGIYLSFCKFRTVTNATFNGFANYAKAFGNKDEIIFDRDYFYNLGKSGIKIYFLTCVFHLVAAL